MFPTTPPRDIAKLAEKYLIQPEHISVEREAATSAKESSKKLFMHQNQKNMSDLLRNYVDVKDQSLFFKTKQGADQLTNGLSEDSYSALAVHGDLRQHKRERVINSFRRGCNQVMGAADVASHGLDILHIQHVIDYDVSQSQAGHIHRIVRTARTGA